MKIVVLLRKTCLLCFCSSFLIGSICYWHNTPKSLTEMSAVGRQWFWHVGRICGIKPHLCSFNIIKHVHFKLCKRHCSTYVHASFTLALIVLHTSTRRQVRVKRFCLYFCICSIQRGKNSSCHYDIISKYGNSGGDCYHEPLEKEPKEEAALSTAVVCEEIKYIAQNVDGESSNLATPFLLLWSRLNYSCTAPMISRGRWRFYSSLSAFVIQKYGWNERRVQTEGSVRICMRI